MTARAISISMALEQHELECDILVAGGGAAGVPCALAAARCGARVILCQDRPVLGGNASSEVRMHIVGANGTGSFERGAALETEAREGGIIEEIRLENCVRNPQRSASMFDLILYEKCRAENNLTLLLNTSVVSVEKTGNRIDAAIAERQSTEDGFRIRGRIFIDCTGDGRLAYEAGAAFMEGREAREEFCESLATETADRQRLGSTILLQARKHDRPMPFSAPEWVREFSQEDLRLRLYANPGEESPTHEYGYWWAEWGGTLDTVKDNEAIRDELLGVTLGIWNHIKNGPGAEKFKAECWALDWIGFLPGKRESRRFVGRYVLTERDILESREFPDAIAYGGWSLDLHPPEGVDAPGKEPCVQHPVPHLYDIPLDACVARDLENLMFAGRNISATHVAFSSTRVMATCAVVGQGVGTAAAHAVLTESALGDPETMVPIQHRLLEDDAYLIGRRTVPGLVAMARITASSGDGEAIRSGQTRSVHGSVGAPLTRNAVGSHRWSSDPSKGLPASLTMEWDEPVSVKSVQLVFDTGLHRHLTLSHHDGYTAKMGWGAAQPETVRDYEIEGFVDGEWRTLVEVTGNYQRLRRHGLAGALKLTALRTVVHATNGLDHARVMELRLAG
jgi:hypothetical protein